MTEAVKNFIKLATENPDLPVIPLVDGELNMDGYYDRWAAGIGYSEIGEYAVYDDGIFFDRDEFKDVYLDDFADDFEEMSVEEKAETLNAMCDKIFKPCILVNIDFPDAEIFYKN